MRYIGFLHLLLTPQRKVICAIVLVLTGCTSSLNTKESAIHFQAAQHYEFTQDYTSAREQYWKALVNAKLAKADPYTISMLTYNFARMTGYTCHFDEEQKNIYLSH